MTASILAWLFVNISCSLATTIEKPHQLFSIYLDTWKIASEVLVTHLLEACKAKTDFSTILEFTLVMKVGFGVQEGTRVGSQCLTL